MTCHSNETIPLKALELNSFRSRMNKQKHIPGFFYFLCCLEASNSCFTKGCLRGKPLIFRSNITMNSIISFTSWPAVSMSSYLFKTPPPPPVWANVLHYHYLYADGGCSSSRYRGRTAWSTTSRHTCSVTTRKGRLFGGPWPATSISPPSSSSSPAARGSKRGSRPLLIWLRQVWRHDPWGKRKNLRLNLSMSEKVMRNKQVHKTDALYNNYMLNSLTLYLHTHPPPPPTHTHTHTHTFFWFLSNLYWFHSMYTWQKWKIHLGYKTQ